MDSEEGGTGGLPRSGNPLPALPCLRSNNCTETEGFRVPKMGSADMRRMFVVRSNADSFVRHWQERHTLFFTVTAKSAEHPVQFAERWHSWKSHCGDWVKGYLKVLEPQQNLRPHYHNLAGVDFDTLPERFDWEALRASQAAFKAGDRRSHAWHRDKYAESAAPQLRDLWRECRPKEMEKYGLGRAEILPVRNLGAAAHYVGKYLEGDFLLRPVGWKGVRRYEMDRTTSKFWRGCSSKYGVALGNGSLLRQRAAALAFALGVKLPGECSLSDLSPHLGENWWHTLRGALYSSDSAEFIMLCESLGRERGHLLAKNGPEETAEQWWRGKVPESDNGCEVSTHWAETL